MSTTIVGATESRPLEKKKSDENESDSDWWVCVLTLKNEKANGLNF
jgi:hypothetical protein